MDKFIKWPVDVAEAMCCRKLSPLHFQIMIYVIRKTYGFGKPYGDYLAIAKMAQDIGRHRGHVSRAVSDLEKMGMLKVEREWNRKGHKISVRPVSDWDETVQKTVRRTENSTVQKTVREPYRNLYADRTENCTYNRYSTIDTLQKKETTPPIDDANLFPAEEGWFDP